MKFNFDPTLQNTWVREGRFPATPRMPGVVLAQPPKAGCKIVGLTGRNNAQRVATLDNLAKYYPTPTATRCSGRPSTSPSGRARTPAGVRRLRARRQRRLVLDDRLQGVDAEARAGQARTASWRTSATSSAT